MATSKGTTKIQCTLSNDLIRRLDNISRSLGTSRSALMAMYIGQGVNTYEISIQQLEQSADKIVNKLAEMERKGELK